MLRNAARAPRDPSDLTRVCAGYQAPGEWHTVFIALDEAGRWQVFDSSPAGRVLVETLCGHDDRIDQAQALALDYAHEQAAFHTGEREFDPLPRAQIGSAPPRAA
jgi:hypothetical protein